MGSQAFRSAVAEPQPAEVAPEPVRRSVGIPKQSLTPPQRTVAIAAVAVLAGLIAATSGASPTTIGWWNAVLSFGFGALLVAAASKGPRWSSIMFSTVAMAAASINLWTLVGAVGLVLAVLSAGLDRRNRVVAAMAAACSLQLMLRWPAFGFFGLPSLVAGAMAAVVLVQGYRYGEKRQRSIARRSAVGLALVTLVVAAVSGIQLLNARPDIEQGLEAGRAAVKAVTDADPDTAVAELDAAQRSLEAARSSVDAPGAKLLQFVPIAAQHYDVLSTALHHGTEITDQVAATAQDANIRSISLELGSVDLSTLDVLAPNLQETSRRLDAAQTDIETSRTGWLVRPVDSRTQATLDELTDIAHTTRVASDAATVLPEMLGQADPKRYLVMFGTPTEAREFGGLFGSWGLIEFNQGRVDLVESGRVIRLKPLGLQNGLDAQQYPEWFVEFAQPAEFPQNLTGTPSERVLAEAAREMFDGLGGGAIDGVIYLDVVALIDLLEVTGPVEIPLQDAPLTTENAAEFFFRDQYAFDSGRGRSEAFNRLAEVAAVVLDRMSAQRLPGPERLGRILGPAARGGHLQVITFDQHLRQQAGPVPDPPADVRRHDRQRRDRSSDRNRDFHIDGASRRPELRTRPAGERGAQSIVGVVLHAVPGRRGSHQWCAGRVRVGGRVRPQSIRRPGRA